MNLLPHTWVLVLAAGEGERLASLTIDQNGRSVPKQFCSLNGGESLLQETLRRARRLVPDCRVCTIVARSHGGYWRRTLRSFPVENIIVQPENRGTCVGMLLGILRILERDPGAQIIILPSDHHVLDEKRFVGTIRIGADLVDRAAEASALRERMLLIGVAPEEADPELGYIVQGDSLGNGIRGVSQFVEKPSATGARTLIERGAVWNSFILVAHGTTALACIEKRYPNIVGDMIKALRLDATHGTSALQDLYQDIPVLDFSRSIAQGAESALCVKASPICGWTDLGTPQRVGRALHGLWTSPKRKAWFRGSHTPAFVDLATRYSQLSGAIGNPAPFAV